MGKGGGEPVRVGAGAGIVGPGGGGAPGRLGLFAFGALWSLRIPGKRRPRIWGARAVDSLDRFAFPEAARS